MLDLQIEFAHKRILCAGELTQKMGSRRVLWEWGEEHSQVAQGEQNNGGDQDIEEGRGRET